MPGFGPPFNPAVVQALYVAGRWYPSGDAVSGSNTNTVTANVIRLQLVRIKRPITISDLWLRVSTLAASGNVQMALYGSDPATQMPAGTAICTTASMSTAAVGNVSATIVGSGVLAPGIYWLATNADASAGGVATYAAISGGGVVLDAAMIGSTTLANVNGALTFTLAQTFGTWPNMTGQTLVESVATNSPILWGFKVSVGG